MYDEPMDPTHVDQFISAMAEQAARAREACIINALSNGIGLHEMAIKEWFEQDGTILRHRCEAVRVIK